MSVVLMRAIKWVASILLLGLFTISITSSLNIIIGEDSSFYDINECVNITVQGSYKLTRNITGLQNGKEYCIRIDASNVVLDGKGYSLTGPGSGQGIYVIDGINITLADMFISGYDYGIDLLGPMYMAIFNNTIVGMNDVGLQLLDSNYNKVFYNTLMNNSGESISVIDSDNNTINHNVILYSKTGIYLDSADNNKIFNNIVYNASEQSIYLWGSENNLIYNNLFNSTTNRVVIGKYYNAWNTSLQLEENIIGGDVLGGNAWFNPDGFGFSETCEDNDNNGICDMPFVFDENNIDYLPLKYVQPLLTTTLTTPTITFTTFTSTTLETTIPSHTTTTSHETATTPLPPAGDQKEDGSYIMIIVVFIAVCAVLIILYISRRRSSER